MGYSAAKMTTASTILMKMDIRRQAVYQTQSAMIDDLNGDTTSVTDNMIVSVPFIQPCDDDIYTYTAIRETSTGYRTENEGWLSLNVEEGTTNVYNGVRNTSFEVLRAIESNDAE